MDERELNEELENLVELSKATLASYVDGASLSVHNNAYRAGRTEGQGKGYDTKKLMKSFKRQSGISKAVKKLATEETLDEKTDPLQYYGPNWSSRQANVSELHVLHKGKHVGTVKYTGRVGADWSGVHLPTKKRRSDWSIDTVINHIVRQHSKSVNEESLEEARGRPRKDANEDGASEADQNIMHQVRKAADSGLKPYHVSYEDGSKHPLPRSQAKRIMSKFMGLKPSEKIEMQNHIAKSHSNLLSHI